MKFIAFALLLLANTLTAQTIELNHGWQFRQQGKGNWYPATVPGTVHTDLLDNQLIPDPFYRDNESKLQWIDSVNWEYRTTFTVDQKMRTHNQLKLVFDGLDTYADVYLNGKLIVQADNMFRNWPVDVTVLVRPSGNELKIIFFSALHKTDSIAKARLPLVLPDNNRVYARKAQYQFGWDWGPKFIGCGIWKPIRLIAEDNTANKRTARTIKPFASLVQRPDSTGTAFYFEKDGKPIYCKGANWIPADIFLPRLKKADYRKLLLAAKEANMNMLRVWGGGIYEADEFYELCDSLHIMVWQDLMFAGGMYPADDAFLKNVKEEVRYQVDRLKRHPCIVVWCGNNEIDEAWHNWGWQDQFNLHGNDSVKTWNDYKKLFVDSIPTWINAFDGTRAYIASSPKIGWGHKESLTQGDSHYWGLWWGLEDWEVFENKTGRFISEYGMQAMPNMQTIESYTLPADRHLASPVIQAHQKASEGFKKLNYYLHRYFIDSSRIATLPLAQYTYLTQCLQYYILKNSIAVQRSKYPTNMGTLLWQLDDCWPVTSWSITDYSRQPKASWYAVKEAYRDDVLPVKDNVLPKDLSLQKPAFIIKPGKGNLFTIQSNVAAKYVYLYKDGEPFILADNYFNLQAGEVKVLKCAGVKSINSINDIKVMSLYDVLTAK